MLTKFSQNLQPHIEQELTFASQAKSKEAHHVEFQHLENAHVIGQESTYWHVKVHCLMLVWGIRNRSPKEFLGQIFRIVGAATKTAIGLVPQGNTGGANVNPFKVLPISPTHAEIIRCAKNVSSS